MFSDESEEVTISDVSCSSSSSSVLCLLESVQCPEESTDELAGLMSTCDCDSDDNITKQRRCHSSALLKKQQKLSPASTDMFNKVRILYYYTVWPGHPPG